MRVIGQMQGGGDDREAPIRGVLAQGVPMNRPGGGIPANDAGWGAGDLPWTVREPIRQGGWRRMGNFPGLQNVPVLVLDVILGEVPAVFRWLPRSTGTTEARRGEFAWFAPGGVRIAPIGWKPLPEGGAWP
ncbi:MAG: hypothetical protein DI532_07025 [Azospirillum brasilense]|uniref:Uncharacterized protein n=1 Tax=Roseomonas gilardii TaxID=257708 RepID=A0A1L7AGZ7_9PROT|nr:hypothetical protein RGI145_13890 [Roseomonas gilardii]PZR15129.1 MAG: hypothetical protein DI532_07025 [Azospirillum brasilense]